MKPHLIDILELFKKRVPQDSLGKGAIRFTLDEAAIRSNLEIIYSSGTNRLAQLAYFVDASLAIAKLEGFKPSIEARGFTRFSNCF